MAPAAPRAGNAARLGSRNGARNPASLTVPGRPESVAEARAFVSSVLGDGHPAADDAVLLTSELVTNAIMHSDSGRSGGKITLAVARARGNAVRVEVCDEGSAGSAPKVKADPGATDGHGLFLVAALADRWGYACNGHGTTVWFAVSPGC